MNRTLRLMALVVVALIMTITGATSVHAWGYCDKSFVFMGKTVGDTCTLAYMEVGYGECERWYTHYLTLGPEGLIDSQEKGIDRPGLPVWDLSMCVGDTLEWVQRFQERDGRFVIDYSGNYSFTPPAFDSAFDKSWRDKRRAEPDTPISVTDIDEPQFDQPAQLVWHHPGGMYKNYKIEEAIKSGPYVFIRTSQTMPGEYGTRRGVLIFLLR